MTRGIRTGGVTKVELSRRLGLSATNKLKLIDLLRLAVANNKITPDELRISTPTEESTIKCYLYSIVNDKNVREKLENYVVAASQLYTRGSLITNIIAEDIYGSIERHEDEEALPRYVPRDEQGELSDLWEFVEDDDAFKQCFLPERWPSGQRPRGPLIASVLEEFEPYLEYILPDWLSVMKTSGWDNAINRMYSKYHANIMNHMTVHLIRFVNAYIPRIQMDNGSTPELLVSLFKKPRPFAVHNDDYAFVMSLRSIVGVEVVTDYLPRKPEYNFDTFSLMMFLVKKGVTSGNYLPISTVGRKYCYMDAKVARFLLPALFKTKKTLLGRDPEVVDMFDLRPEDFRRRRKLLRQRLRRKYKNQSKKLRKKWMKLGCSNMPRDADVYSFETDGVGASVVIHRRVSLYERSNTEYVEEAPPMENPVQVGVDTGRAKLYTAAISPDPIKRPETVLFTRRRYYHEIKHHIRTRWENQRASHPDVKQAILEMALNRGKSNIVGYLESVVIHYDTLKAEYIDHMERALWTMRLFRLKKRSLDSAVQRIFDRGKGRPMVIGIGNGSFPCTGKGEKAMPTTQLTRAFLKARFRYKGRVKFLSINEFRTTMCCCACGSVTTAPMKNDGRRSGRLRSCTTCNEPNAKIRDRDVQAARNMLWLTQYEHLHCDRPWYLCRNQTP